MKGVIAMSGGGVKLFAAIGVSYPEGSTLTCTNGTKTLKAKTTTGQWVFAIPEAGTWTVTATDGTDTDSQAVSITTEGQFSSVELTYRYYLFMSGEGYPNGHTIQTVAGTHSLASDNSHIEFKDSSYSSIARGYLDPEEDVTKYSTLVIEYELLTSSTSNNPFGLVSGTANLPTGNGSGQTNKPGTYICNLDLSGDPDGRKTAALDISSVSGKHYIAWSVGPTTNVYNLYLA